MSDYTLPPLPLPAAAAFAPQVEAYGHAYGLGWDECKREIARSVNPPKGDWSE